MKLTDTEVQIIATTASGAKALRLLNEAEARVRELEAELAEALRLMRECQPWMPSSRSCSASRELDEFLRTHPAG